jgi:hypothetical protein
VPSRPLTDPDVQIFRYLRSSVLLSCFTNLETHMLMFPDDWDLICCVSAEFWAGFVNSVAKINLPKFLVTRRINNLADPDW